MHPLAQPFDHFARTVPAFAQALGRHQAGDLAGARAAYLDLLDQPGLTAVCLHQLGLIAAVRGEHVRAAELFRRSIRLDPAPTQAYRNLSAALDRAGDPAGAVAALMDLGCALQGQGQHQAALAVYDQVLERDPLVYGAHVNAGTGLAWLGELPPAARRLLAGVTLYGRVDHEVAVFAAELCRQLAGRIDGVAEAACALPPGLPSGPLEKIGDALTTLGKVLSELGHPDSGLACHRRSVAAAPGFALGHWNLALALLAAGDFAGGWAEYEWRWQWERFPDMRRRVAAPPWRGQPLAGKRILVSAEQGYGDAIQFAPLVPKLARMGAEVLFEVPTPLLRLFQQTMEGVTVIGRPDSPLAPADGNAPDFVVPHLSLPHLLNLTAADLPLHTGGWRCCPSDAAAWAERIPSGPRRKVGIVWAGRPTHTDDARRSIPFRALRSLLRRKGIDWYSLQVGPRAGDLQTPSVARPADLSPLLGDFADTAAAIARLDLVIAVDTAVAHLSAAMGRPTWLLLAQPPDWRWSPPLADRWYPSLRVFRQTWLGDWAGVLQAVGEAL